jgi:NADPH:quinone reductase-like Zn-dependent oxidoreductase
VPPKPTGKALLIWGGATSVGSNGIQLAVAAGYEIITTASPKNFDYVKKLGASQVFDYNSKTIVDGLIEAFKGRKIARVLDCIGVNGVFEACVDTLLKSNGNKFIAACRHPPENIPDGISTKFIFGSDLKDNEVSKAIYVDFLPKALAAGK